jgi:hypothetical protein
MKVFWFFFSKKNRLLAGVHAAVHPVAASADQGSGPS